MNINKDFRDRCTSYFGCDSQKFIEELNKACTHGLFLNTTKANKEDILKLFDFDIKESNLNPNSYFHNNESIGKTKLHELGLIYPQDVESSLFTNYLNDMCPNLIVDLCAAPGGKTIDVVNKFKNAHVISNDVNRVRALELSKNIERLGLDNVTITSIDTKVLSNQLQGNIDLVILDVPCSGEGMIRKYPEIMDNYSISNIESLAHTQSDLLEDAYKLVIEGGVIVYSTCTYALEEDENQVKSFLDRHHDIELVEIDNKDNYSTLKGTIKLCPLNGTEGQFISIFRRKSANEQSKIKYLKEVKNNIVDRFIKDNTSIDNYYLYQNDNNFYLSFKPLISVSGTIRNGIYLGELKKDRFEPSHTLYRSNSIFKLFKYKYDLNDEEYEKFVNGLELKVDLENNYYLVTYKGYSLGFGKVSNNTLKNKYPKGLRRQ